MKVSFQFWEIPSSAIHFTFQFTVMSFSEICSDVQALVHEFAAPRDVLDFESQLMDQCFEDEELMAFCVEWYEKWIVQGEVQIRDIFIWYTCEEKEDLCHAIIQVGGILSQIVSRSR